MIDAKEQLTRQKAVQDFILEFGNINNIDKYQYKYGALLALIETQIGFLHKLENPEFDQLTIDACYTEHYLRQQQLFDDMYFEDMRIIYLPDLSEQKQLEYFMFDNDPTLLQTDVELLGIHSEHQPKYRSSHTNAILPTIELSEAEHLSPITEDTDSTNIDSKKTTPELKAKKVRGHGYIKDWLIFLNINPKANQHPNSIKIRELEEKKRSPFNLTPDEMDKLKKFKASLLKDIPIADRIYDSRQTSLQTKPLFSANRKAPYPSSRKRELGNPLSFWQASTLHATPGKTNTKLPEKARFLPLQKL